MEKEKNYRFCNLRKWKAFNKKQLRDGPLENLLGGGGGGRRTKKNSRKGKFNLKKFLHAN